MGFDIEKSFIMAERLKQLREGKGLSHEKLSKTLLDQYGVKISSDSLINYEVSDANHTKAYKNQGMRVEYLRCLADFYGVSSDYLLGSTDIESTDATLQSINKCIGLSEEAIKWLLKTKEFDLQDDLSVIFENRSFQRIVRNLIDYVVTVEAEVITGRIARKHFPPGNDYDKAHFEVANKHYLEDLDEIIANCDTRHSLALRAQRGLDSMENKAILMSITGFTVDDDGFKFSDLSVNRVNRHMQNLLQELERRAVEAIVNDND